MLAPPAWGANSSNRILVVPRFAAGQVFRYNIQLRTVETSQATGPVVEPEKAMNSQQSIDVILRLEVVSASGTADAPNSVRLRATYEKVAANSASDTPDADATAMQQDYQKLQGRSIEFTLHPNGRISDISGIEHIVANPARAAAVNQWLTQLTLGVSVPRKGIIVGEKWSSELPVEDLPFRGIIWGSVSTFAQEEPCPTVMSEQKSEKSMKEPVTAAQSPDECAIIYTSSQIPRSSSQKDRTPETYRQNGLRTSGEWNGQSEALTAISLRTGMVVSMTQSGTTHMDFTVISSTTGNRIHYEDNVQSETQISLISESAIP